MQTVAVDANYDQVFSGYNDRLEIQELIRGQIFGNEYRVEINEVVDNVGVSCEFNGCFVLSGFDNRDGKYLFPRTEYCYIGIFFYFLCQL